MPFRRSAARWCASRGTRFPAAFSSPFDFLALHPRISSPVQGWLVARGDGCGICPLADVGHPHSPSRTGRPGPAEHDHSFLMPTRAMIAPPCRRFRRPPKITSAKSLRFVPLFRSKEGRRPARHVLLVDDSSGSPRLRCRLIGDAVLLRVNSGFCGASSCALRARVRVETEVRHALGVCSSASTSKDVSLRECTTRRELVGHWLSVALVLDSRCPLPGRNRRVLAAYAASGERPGPTLRIPAAR